MSTARYNEAQGENKINLVQQDTINTVVTYLQTTRHEYAFVAELTWIWELLKMLNFAANFK